MVNKNILIVLIIAFKVSFCAGLKLDTSRASYSSDDRSAKSTRRLMGSRSSRSEGSYSSVSARTDSGRSVPTSNSIPRKSKAKEKSRIILQEAEVPKGYKYDPHKTFKEALRRIYFNNRIGDLKSTDKCQAAIWLNDQRQARGQYLKDEILEQFMDWSLLQLAEGCQDFYDEIYTTFNF